MLMDSRKAEEEMKRMPGLPTLPVLTEDEQISMIFI
jgi:hypothetical protein